MTIGVEFYMRAIGKYRRKKQKRIIIIASLSLILFLYVGYAAFSTNLNITAKGNIKEKSRLIQSWGQNSQTDFHSDFYKQNIVSVTFLDNNNVPSNATASWNVSEDKENGEIMAWVVPSESSTTKYDLYIGAKGGVIANPDSSWIFNGFISVKSFNFNNNYDTSNATTMEGMFHYCTEIDTLDLNGFNTKNVTNMHAMFFSMTKLKNINLKNFDTSNVTFMNDMFGGGNSLTTLDLSSFNTRNVTNIGGMFTSFNVNIPGFADTNLNNIIFGQNFDTSNVTDMHDMFSGTKFKELDLTCFNTANVLTTFHMFNNCPNLETLNICSFNTSKTTSMDGMFMNNPSLKNVYVGSNWSTSQANITENLFESSFISSVTVGQC